MEFLGKMIFASDLERLLSRFCLCWYCRLQASLPSQEYQEGRCSASLCAAFPLSTGCRDQPHSQGTSIWLNIPSAWFASEYKACPMASSTQSRKSDPLAECCYCNEIELC